MINEIYVNLIKYPNIIDIFLSCVSINHNLQKTYLKYEKKICITKILLAKKYRLE
ncbi:hypothetical protein QJR36_08595 [Paraclostridium sordellii]|uniref:hypothetical protein n=1 Tax=Paraclostridium sordellii TaxID=1505 RepID=UPI0030CF9342